MEAKASLKKWRWADMDNVELKMVLEEMKQEGTYDLKVVLRFLDEMVELTDSQDILDLADTVESVCNRFLSLNPDHTMLLFLRGALVHFPAVFSYGCFY